MKIIEVKSELGAGKKGSSLGIDALKVVAIEENKPIFHDYQSYSFSSDNYLLFKDLETPNAKYIKGILDLYKQVSPTISACLRDGEMTIVLSSDHSIAGSVISGIKSANPGKKLGIIWIDAHPDLHSPYTSPSGNVHGMPLAAALNIDNIENGTIEISSSTISLWDEVKHYDGIYPKVEVKDVVFIGIRDIDPPERSLIERHNMKVFDVNSVRQKGPDKIANEALFYLQQCDIIYVSFDADIIINCSIRCWVKSAYFIF